MILQLNQDILGDQKTCNTTTLVKPLNNFKTFSKQDTGFTNYW